MLDSNHEHTTKAYIVEVCKSDPIGFVRILEQKYTFRIGLISCFAVRLDRELIIHALAQELSMHLSKHYRGCRCIIHLILQLDIILSASDMYFLLLYLFG